MMEYDDKGNMIKEIFSEPNIEKRKIRIYEYENNTRISEKLFINSSLKSEKAFEYNDDNLIKLKTFDAYGKIIDVELSVYDDNHREIMKKFIKYDRNIFIGTMNVWYETNYDNDGGHSLNIKSIYNNGKLKDWKRYSYDANGNLYQTIVFDVPKPYFQK